MKRFFLLSLLLGLLAACDNDADTTPPGSEKGRRTVTIYMAAQNSLGLDRYHEDDSAEIMNGRQFIADNDRLLLFIDDGNAPRLYRVSRKESKPRLVKQWKTDICSTSPERLREVLDYTRKQFPAEEYGLVMWSHADGWIAPTDTDYGNYEPPTQKSIRPFSFGIDSGPDGGLSNRGAQMGVQEMAQAITASGMYCKFIFFDACLMQNLEVAYALRNATDYVVASPMATPAAGSYYTHCLEQGFFSNDPADIARTYLADVQRPELAGHYSDYGLAISCVSTKGVEALAEVLKEALPLSKLAGRQSPEMAFTTATEDGNETQKALYYQAYCDKYFYRPHNYDARQALRCLLPATAYAQTAQALDAAVTFHGSTPTFWIGPGMWTYQRVPVDTDDFRAVSMFVPQKVYTDNAPYTRHGDLNEAFGNTEWYAAAGFSATGW